MGINIRAKMEELWMIFGDEGSDFGIEKFIDEAQKRGYIPTEAIKDFIADELGNADEEWINGFFEDDEDED